MAQIIDPKSIKTICLVSCGSKKTDHPIEAQSLYRSLHFRLKRQYAEKYAQSWYILSAKYHLLAPNRVIPPYNSTLKDFSPIEKAEWGKDVSKRLDAILAPGDKLIILAGNDYLRPLMPLLTKYVIDLPLQGRGGIGYQNQWLKSQLTGES